ncbi:MAG: hypothetical protein AAFQ87_20400 [Bacteroidota bacterium]
MSLSPHFRSYFLPLGLTGLLLLGLSLFVLSPYFALHQTDLATAVTLDFVLTVPILYFLLIRKRPISKLSISPVVILSFLLATYLIPRESQSLLIHLRTFALPVLELGIFGFIIWQVGRSIKAIRAQRGQVPDFFHACIAACREIFPDRVARVFATEVSLFYYGLSFRKPTPSENAFSYHRKNGVLSLYGAFMGLILLEAVGIHFLIAIWSPALAWVLTALSLYSFFQVFGMVRAIPKRPIRFRDQDLFLPYGLLAELAVPFSTIESVEFSRRRVGEEEIHKLSPLGDFESHNIILHLREPVQMIGLYGRKRNVQKLAFFIDDTAGFQTQLSQRGISST